MAFWRDTHRCCRIHAKIFWITACLLWNTIEILTYHLRNSQYHVWRNEPEHSNTSLEKPKLTVYSASISEVSWAEKYSVLRQKFSKLVILGGQYLWSSLVRNLTAIWVIMSTSDVLEPQKFSCWVIHQLFWGFYHAIMLFNGVETSKLLLKEVFTSFFLESTSEFGEFQK